jgi:hypothetical protein
MTIPMEPRAFRLGGSRCVCVLIAALACVVWPGAVAPRATPSIADQSPVATSHNRIDDLVFARLTALKIQPARLSSDAVFIRRAYLDVIGTLPTADETRAFLADQNPHKRSDLVDRLLERDQFADYWAMKWSDVLRVKSEFPINLWPNAVQAYHHWIRTSVRDNLAVDQFARELLTESGSNFRVPQVNFYRAVQSREPTAIASAVALTFMGARTDAWPKDRLAGMAAFFSAIGYKHTQEWKEEIVYFDSDKVAAGPAKGSTPTAMFPDGTTVKLSPDRDPREVFAAWLTAPMNPYFAPSVVNRVWSWLLGRGIVQEPDDMRPDNPPSNPELLKYLAGELVASHFDLKHVYRLILNSATYQLSSEIDTPSANADANFAHYLLRPLDAEVLIDAIDDITGGTEPYQSAIPEPFTFTPNGQRAVALADGSITSSFLVTFGRSPRDTGLESERNTKPTAAERLALLNSTQVQRKFDQSARLTQLIQSRADVPQLVTALYLAILSRNPTADEQRVAGNYAKTPGVARRVFALDLAWALVNSQEFLYRH